MERMSKTAMAMVAALGTVAAVAAYGSIKPGVKQQLKRDMKNTLDSMESVKNEMGNVGQDMTDMARNLKNNMM